MSVTTMTYDALCVSPFNVRKRKHSPEQVARLADSIIGRGLIFPLVVHPMSIIEKGNKLHGAIAGSGRFNAFRLLIAQGRLPADHPIDVIVRDIKDEGELRDLSLAENLVRLNLYPFEVFAATARANECGRSFREIAEDTGQSISTIRKWVRLGNLHPDVFQALEDGEITEEQAQAIAATEDQALQWHVFEQVRNLPPFHRSPAAIRRLLKIGNDELEVKLRFVGEAAYRDAGGRYELDLFADEAEQRGRVVDEGLLLDLVEAKLERTRQMLRAQVRNATPGRDLRFEARPPQGEFSGVAQELEITAEAAIAPADEERAAFIQAEIIELVKRTELLLADEALDDQARGAAIAAIDAEFEPLEQEEAAIEARATLALPHGDIFATLEIEQDGTLTQRFWWADRRAKRKAEETARKQSDAPPPPVSAGPIAKPATSAAPSPSQKRLTGGAAIDGSDGYGVRQEANAAIRDEYGLTADGIQIMRSIRREMLRAALVQDARNGTRGYGVAADYLLWSLARDRLTLHGPGARSIDRGLAGLAVRQGVLLPQIGDHLARTKAHATWKDAVAQVKAHPSMTDSDLVQAFDDFVAEDWAFKQLVAAVVTGCALERSANVGGYEVELHDHVALLAGCGTAEAQRDLVEPTEELIGLLPRTRQLELAHPHVSNTEYLRLDKLKAAAVTAPIVRALRKAKDWVHPLLRFKPRIIATMRHELKEAAE